MGIFATFAGFCYNDMTSIPLYIFGESCYTTDFHAGTAVLKKDCVYPIGLDPTWYMAANELSYVNSLKMKMSVIFGVLQMALGVLMKALNAAYFGRKLEFFFEFIPQFVLLLALFGFMDLMIIAKWLIDWENYPNGEGNPPSIVSQMIDMMIKGGVLTGSELIPNMVPVMQILLLVSFACVPIMLCVRPCYEGCRRAGKGQQVAEAHEDYAPAINDDGPDGQYQNMDGEEVQKKKHTGHKEHAMSDIIVH